MRTRSLTFANIKTPTQMAEYLRRMEQAGDTWHSPLIRAAMAGALRFVVVSAGARVPLPILDMQRNPVPLVVIVGGDAGGPALPDAFPQARRLMRWAGFIFLHGTGGEAWHYALAAEAAAQVRRVLIVETTGAALPAWVALKAEVAGRTPSLGFKVRPGMPAHPHEKPPAGVPLQ